ncbi:MAG: asparagine synthase (glutamine-hydrolyzing) [Phycisphaerales bacterium]|jgi:asparagine synthase (glutamine-hydrolysing)
MCGIAGVLRIHEPGRAPHPLEAIPEAWLDVLDEGIKHRGPDGQGRFRDRATRPDGAIVDVAFVHRRLSILDHEGGHQPMVHDGQRLRPDLTYQPGEEPKLAHELCSDKPLVAVVFNGCIYNQHELRAELTQQGAKFETNHSDTEVLVHGWRAWGQADGHASELQRRLRSMHAALVWDRRIGRVQSLRDVFGEKPLYRLPVVLGITFAWSSAPAAFRANLEDAEHIQPSALRGWIRHGWHTRFHTVNETVVEERCASDDPTRDDGTPMPGGFGVAHWIDHAGTSSKPLTPHRLEELIRKAVSLRLEADVPLGCFLSGGIDSSLITKIALDELGSMQCFTVRMPDAAYDESSYAQEAAQQIGASLAVLDCHDDPARDLVHLIEGLGLPFGDSSLLPTYWVCRAAGDAVRVALAGDGGDELFAGYDRHTIRPLANKLRPISRFVHPALFPDQNPRSRTSKARRLLAALRTGDGSLSAELVAVFPRTELSRLLGPQDDRLGDAIRTLKSRSRDVRIWDIDYYLRGDLLRKTDTASMAVPLEVRCPFLDAELAQAAIEAPNHVLMPNNERKGLLKQVARQYLPASIVDRPKQGFAIPIGQWFRDDYGGLRQLLYDHLESAEPFPALADSGVSINMKFVRQMLREHDAAGERSINPWHGRDHSQRLYMLLVLSIWAKWLDGLRPAEPLA